MQWHLDKSNRRKDTSVANHHSSIWSHSSAFELKNQVNKTFISLLKFSLNLGKVWNFFLEQFGYSCYSSSSEVTWVSEARRLKILGESIKKGEFVIKILFQLMLNLFLKVLENDICWYKNWCILTANERTGSCILFLTILKTWNAM